MYIRRRFRRGPGMGDWTDSLTSILSTPAVTQITSGVASGISKLISGQPSSGIVYVNGQPYMTGAAGTAATPLATPTSGTILGLTTTELAVGGFGFLAVMMFAMRG